MFANTVNQFLSIGVYNFAKKLSLEFGIKCSKNDGGFVLILINAFSRITLWGRRNVTCLLHSVVPTPLMTQLC